MSKDQEPTLSALAMWILAFAILGTIAVGVGGVILAIFALYEPLPIRYTGAGLALIAAALAFGFLVNAVLRD